MEVPCEVLPQIFPTQVHDGQLHGHLGNVLEGGAYFVVEVGDKEVPRQVHCQPHSCEKGQGPHNLLSSCTLNDVVECVHGK